MMQPRNLIRGVLAASALLIGGLAGGPVQAQVSAMDFDANPNCGDFQRWGHGGWTAVRPTSLAINNGMVLSFMPGDSMGPGSTIGGVAVPIILDRHCGNM
jgi:hypothetical protein